MAISTEPSKTIDTLVPDIMALFEKGHSVSDEVGRFADKLGAVFIDRFAKYAEEKEFYLRLSAIGRPLRQLWYDSRNTPKNGGITGQVKFKFLYGDILEELILFLAVEAGHTVEDLQRTVEVDGVPGHIDCRIDGVLVDVKSCSPRSFLKFKNGQLREDDPFGYIYQLSSYWSQIPAERAGFLAIDKVSGELCFMELTREDRRTDGEVRERITAVRSALASDVEPARCYEPRPLSKTDKSGNLVLGVGCSYCDHRNHCWRDANGGQGLKTYFYSTGPKHFVHIEKEPRVPSQSLVEVASEDFKFPTRED